MLPVQMLPVHTGCAEPRGRIADIVTAPPATSYRDLDHEREKVWRKPLRQIENFASTFDIYMVDSDRVRHFPLG